MATIIAEATGKAKKIVKNVSAHDIEAKVEQLENQGYTRISVVWGKTRATPATHETALPASVDRGNIEEWLG
jgi:hypothetical protein